jgi:multidrug efflux system outer membrane protein
MRKLVLLLAIVSLLLASCKVGQNYKGHEVTFPETYTNSAGADEPTMITVNIDSLALDSALNIDWFSIFDDPVLDSLVFLGLNYNQDLAIAAENIAQAQSALTIQRSQMLPSVGYQLGARSTNYNLIEDSDSRTILSGFGSVSWELDFWGKYRRLNEAAKANILASEYGYQSTRISLIGTIATTYFQLLDYQMRLDISLRTLALRDSMLLIISARFDKGIIPEIDLAQAQIQQAIAAGTIPIWERLIVQTQNLLSLLTGSLPREIETGISLEDQSIDIKIPEGLPSQLLVRRPDIQVAEQQLIAQNAIVGAAKAGRFPNVSLTGLLGVATQSSTNFSLYGPGWNAGASLLGPVFNWGAINRQIDIEESRYKQSLLAYDRTVNNAFREVENSLNEIQSLKKELVAREAHVDAAVRAQILSQERYNQGVTSYLEYLESQRQAFEAELNLATTKQQLLSAYANLYLVLGGGW